MPCGTKVRLGGMKGAEREEVRLGGKKEEVRLRRKVGLADKSDQGATN
jgi:hypothetical protein